GEEGLGMHGQYGSLLAEVLDPNGGNRSVWGHSIAEPLDVRLAEGPLPREGLAGHRPRALVPTRALGDIGQRHRHLRGVIDGGHFRGTVPALLSALAWRAGGVVLTATGTILQTDHQSVTDYRSAS